MATTERPESQFDPGDNSYVLICTSLVWFMIPGLGLFYSGLARTKAALSMLMLCLWSMALVSFQWFFIGYSLVFSKNAIFFIGNFDNIFLMGVFDNPAVVGDNKIPSLLFCVYQGMFASIAAALILGGSAERSRFLPTSLFILIWTTFVYDFIACWTWNPSGWANTLGGLDFAGERE